MPSCRLLLASSRIPSRAANAIGDAGATAVAAALKENTALTSLALPCASCPRVRAARRQQCILTSPLCPRCEDNGIGDSGATAIASSLKYNTTLKLIDLKSECAAMVASERVQSPEFHCGNTFKPGNGISHTGATALAEALVLNFVLQAAPECSYLSSELRSHYRRPIMRCVVRTRVMCQAGRCRGAGARGGVAAWLCERAPLWVVVHVCALLRETVGR